MSTQTLTLYKSMSRDMKHTHTHTIVRLQYNTTLRLIILFAKAVVIRRRAFSFSDFGVYPPDGGEACIHSLDVWSVPV